MSIVLQIGHAGTLALADDVRVERWSGGLALVESGRRHLFNRAGTFLRTESEVAEQPDGGQR